MGEGIVDVCVVALGGLAVNDGLVGEIPLLPGLHGMPARVVRWQVYAVHGMKSVVFCQTKGKKGASRSLIRIWKRVSSDDVVKRAGLLKEKKKGQGRSNVCCRQRQ